MDKEEKLAKLVDQFKRNIKQYKSNAYDEANTRTDFIDKFFELLDWDVRNEEGYSEQYRDVVREDKVVIEGKPKAPDYSFRIGGIRKFFVEAKKPLVNIKEDIGPAFQLRRYAYTAKLPLSILTDFEEISIYDTRIKPNKDDKASVARIYYCTYDELLSQSKYDADKTDYQYLYDIFSKPAILKGSFDKYIDDKKNKKGTSEVDKEFLKLIEEWRTDLAKSLALRNKELDIFNLNQAVQKIIDRIIFLRIAEDKKSEEYGRLLKLSKDKEIYPKLNVIFNEANDKYNSGLFKVEEWLSALIVDDKALTAMIKSLYYPECPYEFSVLPVEILGHIYEQFLGKTIRLTSGHQAKIEEKPEVRKAGGVYYTPEYIVNYIVENTVGEKIKRKDPVKIKEIKILDPACGSGSFLVGAYSYLMKYYLGWYLKKSYRDKALRNGDIYQAGENDYRLSVKSKQAILVNNIFGVDIDAQAVEVTKLSLLLKLMEDENLETQDKLFSTTQMGHILPDLSSNIKCGNSLIGSDFYADKQLDMYDNNEMRKINVFDWDKEYPDIFAKGGFECVIGNPPYVDIKGLSDFNVQYVFKKFKHANNRINLFATFIEKSFKFVVKNFKFSMIVPTALLAQDSYKSLRETILEKYHIDKIIRLPNEIFGENIGDVKVDTMIFIFSEINKSKTEIIAYSGYDRIKEINKKNAFISGFINATNWSKTNDKVWAINVTDEQAMILSKIESQSLPLENFVIFSLGLTPYDKYKGHSQAQIDNKVFHANSKKDKTFKRLLAGNDIKKYYLCWNGNQWISYGSWLGASRDSKFFIEKRILVKQIIDWTDKRIWATITDEELYNTQNAFNLLPDSNLELEFILGIINSKLMKFYHCKRFLDEFKMRFQKILIKDCKKFPIYSLEFDKEKDKSNYDKIISNVVQLLLNMKNYYESQVASEKKTFQKRTDILDQKIDNLVYKLYNLTDEEIKIIESSV